MKIKKIFNNLVFYSVIMCILSPKAYAYIDPGTGSYIFQVITAGIIGFLFSIKLYWHNIKMFVNKRLMGKQNEQDENDLQ
jgi:hypothetical protein